MTKLTLVTNALRARASVAAVRPLAASAALAAHSDAVA
jgi:hypothetical protein